MGNNNENENYEWDRVVETDTWTLNTEEIEKSIIDSTLMQDENLFIAAAMKEQKEQSEKAVEAVAEKLKEVKGSIDESDKDRIRREVNKKIIIQSEELKNKKPKSKKKKLSRREREEQELEKVPVPSFVSSQIYGVETTASSCPVMAFTKLDLPALRRPKKAMCTRSPEGVSFKLIGSLPFAAHHNQG